jgi:outer membrane protein assembly factor BamA
LNTKIPVKVLAVKLRLILPLLVISCLIFSCDPTKKLQSHEYIVNKVEVENSKETGIPKEEFEKFFRQKPNRKFLRTVQFYVWWYNLFDDEKIRRHRAERNMKYDKINAERIKKKEIKNRARIEKGKKPKPVKLKDKESQTFWENIRDIGEPAVVFDSSLTEQTRLQLGRYLFSKGYFDNTVRDSVTLKKRSQRAIIKYFLYPKNPYHVNKITYTLDDPQLGALILKDTMHSLLKKGMCYDEERFQAERERLTNLASNSGYFYFDNAFINYNVDSAFSGHQVSLDVHLKKYPKSFSASNDSIIYANHPKMDISNIYVITEPVIGDVRDVYYSDTIMAGKHGLIFLYNQPIPFRLQVISNNIDLYRGQLFKRDTAEKTYRQLISLGIFQNVTIRFYEDRDKSGSLECFIICNPIIKQSLAGEVMGTNTSGNKGIDGSVIYQNRNLAKGGELLETKMMLSVVAQSQFNTKETVEQTFNTIQFGPELTFSVPRAFFPFSLIPFKKDQSPRTYVKSSLNYQSRPIFNRIITSVDYGFNFKTHKNRLRHDFIPFEIYFVNANLSKVFRDSLLKTNDAFLINSFQDHVTTLSKYTIIYFSRENNQNNERPIHYFRWSVQSSGNILRNYFDLAGGNKDSLGRYKLFGIPFAQFLRTDADYRLYIPLNKRSRLVYRLAGGVGKPLINLNVLPYEQSFFSGGPNGVRAWRARTLGPGGYDPRTSNARFDKIGDILFEGNVEYRFPLLNQFHGALFVDAGNIWRLQPDESKPGGEFILDKFVEQIAIGGGIGIRWDLSFVVIRVDLAVPLRDPKYLTGDRWTFNKRPLRETVVNFGIGYPF